MAKKRKKKADKRTTQNPPKQIETPTAAAGTPLPELEGETYHPSDRLAGKIALVTGASTGIGAAVALCFAKEGANLAIVYHSDTESAKRVARRAEQLGASVLLLKGDVGSEAFAQRAAKRTADRFGHIDLLVNNAGEQHAQNSVLDITAAQLQQTFRTNIFSMFYFVKASLPHMAKGGSILNTASLTAFHGNSDLVDYSATKGAIVSFTKSLSQDREVLRRKIRVNAVAPGAVWTPLITKSFPESHAKKFGKDAPMKRPGQPWEIAPAYVYLASGDASYVSGQVLHVNGGFIV